MLKLSMHLATTLKIIFQRGDGLGEAVFILKKLIFWIFFSRFLGGYPPPSRGPKRRDGDDVTEGLGDGFEHVCLPRFANEWAEVTGK